MRSFRQTSLVPKWLVLVIGGISCVPAWAAGPATQPSEVGKILVLPFTPVNKTDSQPWLGRSVQQSLVADLTMIAPDHAFASEAEANDPDAAVAAGKKADARYVVFGTFTTVHSDVRLTGQVMDVATGKAVGGLKATGPVDDIFVLEDGLARQIKSRLGLTPSRGSSSGTAEATEPEPMAPLRSEQAPPADQYAQTYAPPAPDYNTYNYYYTTSPDYGYGYDYPYWGYPVYGFAFTGSSFGRFHHGFHDGGFHGRFGGSHFGGGAHFGTHFGGGGFHGGVLVGGGFHGGGRR